MKKVKKHTKPISSSFSEGNQSNSIPISLQLPGLKANQPGLLCIKSK